MPANVTKEDVERFRDSLLRLHEKIITVSGGHQGVRDMGGFEHAIYEIIYCSEKHEGKKPFLVAAKAYNLLATRHYFVDGNKRTSHILAKLILLMNEYVFRPKYIQAVEFILEISRGEKSLDEIEKWIAENAVHSDQAPLHKDQLASDIEDMKAVS